MHPSFCRIPIRIGAPLLALLAGPLTHSNAPAAELLAYWDFDTPGSPEVELTGLTPNLTLNNSSQSLHGGGASGAVGDRALDLGTAGNQGWARTPAGTHLDAISATSTYTVAFWQYNRQNTAATSSFWINAPASTNDQRGIQAHVPWSDGTIYFDQSGCCATPGQRLTSAGMTVANQWQHFAFTVDSSGNQSIWINGVQVATQGGTAPLSPLNGIITLGANGVSGGGSFNGLIDEFAIYDDALTAGEIADLADGTRPDFVSTDGDLLDDAFEQLIIDADGGDAIAALEDVLEGDDFDGDGLTNLEEQNARTDPTVADGDGDGLNDSEEVAFGTDPYNADPDGDGLSDLDEVSVSFLSGPMDALQAETNGDVGTFDMGVAGAGDGTGTISGVYDTRTNLLDYTITWQNLTSNVTNMHFHVGAAGASGGVDLGIPGPWSSPYTASGVSVSPAQEANLLAGNWYVNIHTSSFTGGEIRGQVLLGTTNPSSADSDGDGLSDSDEINIHGTNPTLADTDGDGDSDSAELDLGTDPTDAGDVNPPGTVVLSGEVGVFTGPDDLHLDPASVVIAVDLFGDMDRDVNGVTFQTDGLAGGGGSAYARGTTATTTAANQINDWVPAPAFAGADATSAANLGEIMRDMRWEAAPTPLRIDLSGLYPDGLYEIQLLTNEGGTYSRRWDIAVEDQLVVDDYSSQGSTASPPDVWAANNSAYYRGEFAAPADGELNIRMQQQVGGRPWPGGDGNPILQAVVVHLDRTDDDGDGLPNWYEIAKGLDPGTPNSGDLDSDGSPNAAEFDNGTDPDNPDTDGDGAIDGDEATNGTDPHNPDSDGDGLLDGVESNSGTFVGPGDTGSDPLNVDTDGDGVRDGDEVGLGFDPTDPNLTPFAITDLQVVSTLPSGSYNLLLDDGTFIQAYVENDGTSSWLLVGRGRNGWQFDTDGQGNIDDVANLATLGTTAAFAPAMYSDAMINELIADSGADLTGVEIRLKRATDIHGNAPYQEARWRPTMQTAWTGVFDTGGVGYAVEQEIVAGTGAPFGPVATNTYDTFPQSNNDITRVFTWPWGGHGSQKGFSYGQTVLGVDNNNSTTFLWEAAAENHAIPYAEVYIRLRTPDPAAVALDGAEVRSDAMAGDEVGTLSTPGGSAGDTFTYELISGYGGEDNGKFQISGGQLEAGAYDFSTEPSDRVFKIRIRSTGTPSGVETEAILFVSLHHVPVTPSFSPIGGFGPEPIYAAGVRGITYQENHYPAGVIFNNTTANNYTVHTSGSPAPLASQNRLVKIADHGNGGNMTNNLPFITGGENFTVRVNGLLDFTDMPVGTYTIHLGADDTNYFVMDTHDGTVISQHDCCPSDHQMQFTITRGGLFPFDNVFGEQGGGDWYDISISGPGLTRVALGDTANGSPPVYTIVLDDFDSDGDGIPDSYEIPNGLNPNDPADASSDTDMDGLTALEEFQAGTRADVADSDGDSINDGDELANGTNPLSSDTDGDGLDDGVETNSGTFVDLNDTGTDPNSPNTDGDQIGDGAEAALAALGAPPAAPRDPNVYDDPRASNAYMQDFDIYPDGTTELGDGSAIVGTAVVIGGQLQMTTNTNSNNAAFHIPSLLDVSEGWSAVFDYTIIGVGTPADGFSFSSGSLPWGQLSGQAEEGFPGVANVISFEMDTWNDPADAGPAIGVNRPAAPINSLDASTVANNLGLIMAPDTTISGTIAITLEEDGTASFVSTGALTDADFVGILSGFLPGNPDTFALAARTGGANEEVLIDNIVIITGPGSTARLVDVELNASNTEGTLSFEGLEVGESYHVLASDDAQNFIPLDGSQFVASAESMAVGPFPVDVAANPSVYVKGAAGALPSALPFQVDFDTDEGGFTTRLFNPLNAATPGGPWIYGAAAGEGGTGGFSADGAEGGAPFEQWLTSPSILIPSSGNVILEFDHSYNFEPEWDGGVVFISVNGGPYGIVTDFTENGYSQPLQTDADYGYLGDLNGVTVFNGDSGGFVHSTANLGSLTAGDIIQIRFVGMWDWGTVTAPPNWAIDNVEVSQP